MVMMNMTNKTIKEILIRWQNWSELRDHLTNLIKETQFSGKYSIRNGSYEKWYKKEKINFFQYLYIYFKI